MYWIRIYPNFPAFSNSLQVLRGHLSQPDALYSHVMKTATDSRYSRIEWHEHSCLWKMLHHVACALPRQHFPDFWHFSLFLVIFHCIETKNLTLFRGFCQLPATRLQTGAEEETERLGLVTLTMLLSLVSGFVQKRHSLLVILHLQNIQFKSSTVVFPWPKTQRKSGLQAARHLQGREIANVWFLCLWRLDPQAVVFVAWIGNLLSTAKLENCPSLAGTSHLQTPRWACCWEVHDVVLRSIMNILPHACFKFFVIVCLCVCVCATHATKC